MLTADNTEQIKDLSSVKVQEIFEGPLDLLLYLIHVNEINIYDIPIALITEQYLDYINTMNELNLDIAGEFLLMASNLIYIKSRMLLPRIDEEETETFEDPRKELVERLIEHEKFRNTARILREMEQIQSQFLNRKNYLDSEIEYELDEISIDQLLKAYQIRINFGDSSNYKYKPINIIDINDKIEHILEVMNKNKKMNFIDLIPEEISRSELIVFFLALLELIRKKVLKVTQKTFLGTIIIFKVENL
jgi:segregation and condensation protein A